MIESVQNSPLVLALVQVLVVIGNAYLLARQKNRAEVEKRDVEGFRTDLGTIRQLAESARATAEAVNRDLYEAVRGKCERVLLELAACRSENSTLQETVKSLSNKLASREKVERNAAKKAAAEEEEDGEEALPAGIPDAATLAKLGAIPLSAPTAVPAAPVTSNFGKVAGRR
jgi:hypothetical protein